MPSTTSRRGSRSCLCLDPQTGGELWRQIRRTDALAESQDAYTSPFVRQTEHGAEIVVFGADYVTSHHPETGVELWRSGSLNAKKSTVWRTIASPVAGPSRQSTSACRGRKARRWRSGPGCPATRLPRR